VHQDLIYDVGMNNGDDTVSVQVSFGSSTLASPPKKASCLFGSVRPTQSGVLLIEKTRLAMVTHITRSWCRVVGLLRFLRNLEYLTT
jgi:hypothetical protein